MVGKIRVPDPFGGVDGWRSVDLPFRSGFLSSRANENDPSAGVMRPYGKGHLTLGRNALA